MGDKVEEEIFDLIRKSNFKQCNERISQLRRQLPKSVYFQVLEVYAKYKQSPSKFNYEASLGKDFGLNGNKVTTEIRALELLHRFFVELEKYDEALNIYEQVNFKYPSFDLTYEWFSKALDDFNLKHMSKSSLQLVKFRDASTVPVREYYFWNAISTIALFKYQSYKLNKQEKSILPLLAYKNLCNLKPFISPQEVIVFCSVCEELFPNDATKKQEIVDECLPQLADSVDLYLKNFMVRNIKENDHQTMFDGCRLMLKSIDDYELIKNLIKSGKELGQSTEELKKLIYDLVGDSRNSRLANFELDLAFESKITDSSLTFYLSKFHNKPCCAADIENYRNYIDDGSLKSIFTSLVDQDDLIHDANAYKLNLCETSTIELYSKHKESLKSKPKTDYSSNSVFILDIVKDILKGKPDLKQVLLALSVLENYQSKDLHNFDTSVWMIALYMYLGLVPLAYSYFLELKVKNVQCDSVDFILFSRYASLFPQKQHDILHKTLSEHNSLYDVSMARLSRFQLIAFERKGYSKILGMFDFRSKLERSINRWSEICESHHLARLCNDKRTVLLQQLHSNWRAMEMSGPVSWSDNRDWSIFGDNISVSNLPQVLEYAKVDDDSILINCLKEFMIELIPTNEKNEKLDIEIKKIIDEDLLNKAPLSEIERWSFQIFYDIYANNGDNLQLLLEQSISVPENTWKLSNVYTTKLSTLKTLDNFKRIKDKQTKQVIKNSISQLRESCDDLFSSYKSQIEATCRELKLGESQKLLNSLGFEPLLPQGILDNLYTVQKSMRNL